MLTFNTENSTYEVDQENKRVRRLIGSAPVVRNLGADGDWSDYDLIFDLAIGNRAAIFYRDTAKNQTLTSTIVSIEGDWCWPSAEEISQRFPHFTPEEVSRIAGGQFDIVIKGLVDRYLPAMSWK